MRFTRLKTVVDAPMPGANVDDGRRRKDRAGACASDETSGGGWLAST
jgi:hypothetical protein